MHWLKVLHLACVTASYILFVWRGVWMLRDSASLRQAWVKIVPHVIDSLLLASAIGLAIQTQQYPLVDGWLSAKFFGLVGYITLGTLALKRGKTKTVRLACWLGAQAVFFYIVAVAVTRNPLVIF